MRKTTKFPRWNATENQQICDDLKTNPLAELYMEQVFNATHAAMNNADGPTESPEMFTRITLYFSRHKEECLANICDALKDMLARSCSTTLDSDAFKQTFGHIAAEWFGQHISEWQKSSDIPDVEPPATTSSFELQGRYLHLGDMLDLGTDRMIFKCPHCQFVRKGSARFMFENTLHGGPSNQLTTLGTCPVCHDTGFIEITPVSLHISDERVTHTPRLIPAPSKTHGCYPPPSASDMLRGAVVGYATPPTSTSPGWYGPHPSNPTDAGNPFNK